MSRILRALFLSVVATGAAAVVLYAFGLAVEPSRTPARVPGQPGDEVDRLSEEEQQMLLRELGGQL
jgi:hypothetical protein